MTMTALGIATRIAACGGLFALLAGCRSSPDDARPRRENPIPELAAARWIEPRLTGSSRWQPCRKVAAPDRVVEDADCPGAHKTPPPESICDEVVKTHELAVRLLLTKPACTDAAVERLASLVKDRKGRLWNDLAAAYYVRAQRLDRPTDLLSALDSAQSAVEKDPNLSEARFNLALIQEALGLTTEALASWNEDLRIDHSPWAMEAQQHRTRLTTSLSVQAATRWPLNRQRLSEVAAVGDRAAVLQLVAPFPAAAQRYLEEEILPAWAQALVEGRLEQARKHLELAEMVAIELANWTKDRYLLDAVDRIGQASRSPQSAVRLRALQEGYLAFGRARQADRSLTPKEAARHYARAERFLARAGSPLSFGATLGYATALQFDPKLLTHAFDLLDPVVAETRKRRYWSLLGRVLSNQAFIRLRQSRFIESLRKYEAAGDAFRSGRDAENLANNRVRRMGLLYVLGRNETAWEEALQAIGEASHVVEPQSLNLLLGETAKIAAKLGHFEAALLYQNKAVQQIQGELANLPTTDAAKLQNLRHNLSIALRERSAIQLQLRRYDLARADLNETIRLAAAEKKTGDQEVQRLIQARLSEVMGQASMHAEPADPQGAIEDFTRALQHSVENSFRTYRATLLVERAAAYRAAGDRAAAEDDLQEAIAELSKEEAEILKPRVRGESEELLSAYFSRFQPVYRLLIGQLAAESRSAQAFDYAERARAFEPLDLVLQLGLLPQAFTRLANHGMPLELRQVQASLPPGTYLLEFSVLKDRTLIWLVGHDHFEPFEQKVGSAEIDGWARELQRDAGQRFGEAFESRLGTPYKALLAKPLEQIKKLPAGRDGKRRLVFVPDGAIHGLPLAALRDPRTSHYLIQDFPVAIAASATLYIFSLLRDEALGSPRTPRVLLVGDPAFDTRSALTRGLGRLPNARLEVEQIEQLYPPGVRILVEKEATVPRFLALARESSIIHLAAHSVANPQAPFRSLIVLAPTREHPGLLDAKALLTELRLDKTGLVVLAACRSAGGHAVGPEGLSALVRPFLTAGAPAVVGSLWEVGDDRTKGLLVRFHHYYREGFDAAVALQLAQLDLINDKSLGLRSVLAWAPFQVIGHATSPFSPSPEGKRRSTP